MDFAAAQREFFSVLMESQFWPPEEIRHLQRRRLERLLRHARDHVPFYAARLDGLFDEAGGVDWSRWGDVPIVRRADVRDRGDDMKSLALPVGHGGTSNATTSGSTGIPITVETSALCSIASRAAVFRGQSWHGVDWSKDVLFYMEEEPEAGVWPNVEVGPAWGPSWMAEATGRTLRLNGDTPPQHIIDYISEHDEVGYLSCRAKVAQVVAIEAMRTGRQAKFDAVLAFSTAAHDDEREDVERAFGARILNFYSSKEAHLMAYQCPTGSHLHVAEELVFLELLDDQDRPVPKGSIGRVVVTNLMNWAQPLIRYDHGDLAVEGDQCSCGRTLRVLERIVGRTSDMFRFPDGSAVAFGVPRNFKPKFNIKTWQIAQVGPLELEVRYAPISEEQPFDEDAVAAAMREMMRPDLQIRFRRTESFLPRTGKKFSEYVNELLTTS
ncbi:MAG TPA: hypothetical protein VHA07_12065 [Devosia sp.]|nr:hypothetical protein [Devosia sp.]